MRGYYRILAVITFRNRLFTQLVLVLRRVTALRLLVLPYVLLLLIQSLAFSGYLIHGWAPLVTIVPGFWSLCGDIAVVNYASYISGRRLLDGFSCWSFSESCGSNWYAHPGSLYLSPVNAAGAFLVDHVGGDVFQVFGILNFFLLYFAVACFYYYLRTLRRYSIPWAIFGASLYLAMPRILYSAHFSNYLGIIAFFPLLLITSAAFFKRFAARSAIAYSVTLAAPLFFGMVNIYLNYLLIAALITIVGIAETGASWRRVMFRAGICFVAAIMINAVIWGPLLVETLTSSGQSYTVDVDQLTVNPLEYPLVLIRSLIGMDSGGGVAHALSSLHRHILGLSGVGPASTPFLFLGDIALALTVIGVVACIRGRRFRPALVWLAFVLTWGVLYHYARLLEWRSATQIMDLLKVLKYEPRIAAPFLVMFLLEGLRILIRRRLPSTVRFALLLGFALVIEETVTKEFLWVAKHHLLELLAQLRSGGVSQSRYNLIWGAGLGELGPLVKAGITVTICAILASGLALPRLRTRAYAFVVMFLVWCSVGLHEVVSWGGIAVSGNIPASQYFKPQENETLVRSLLRDDSFLYRAVYIDDLEFLRARFPSDSRYVEPPVPKTNKGKTYRYNTRKYMNRADAVGVPIADGWLFFPSIQKRSLYSLDNVSMRPFNGMSELAWNVVNPYDERLPKVFNVKYILSRYPLDGFRLVSENKTDYWRYLYEIQDATPVCRLSDGGGEMGAVEAFKISNDRIDMTVRAAGPAMVALNMSLDRFWRASVNGATVKISPSENGVFASIPVPSGRSTVILRYKFWPLPVFGVVSCVSLLAMIAGFVRLGRWGKYETDYPNPLL